jgi:hypothetical protein
MNRQEVVPNHTIIIRKSTLQRHRNTSTTTAAVPPLITTTTTTTIDITTIPFLRSEGNPIVSYYTFGIVPPSIRIINYELIIYRR